LRPLLLSIAVRGHERACVKNQAAEFWPLSSVCAVSVVGRHSHAFACNDLYGASDEAEMVDGGSGAICAFAGRVRQFRIEPEQLVQWQRLERLDAACHPQHRAFGER
jgi:hypothetical protein